ncbi:MAG: VOC family protein [Dehalococcoidia bacterium]
MSTSITTYYYTEDPQRLRSFYERALGVQAVAESVDWAEFDVGGAHLAVHRQRPEDPRDMAVPHVDLSVDDIEGAVARFRAAGAGVVREISDASYGRTAVLRDPDGREITLVQVTLP